MSFSECDVIRRTRKGNFLKQIDQLIDWNSIKKAITVHYAPVSDAAGHPGLFGSAVVQMPLTGIWYGGLNDESSDPTRCGYRSALGQKRRQISI